MNVAVIGLGYIGLPTAALIASKGLNVVGVDTNQKIVDVINEGKIHIIEPDLDILVHRVVMNENLHATIKIKKADVFLIAVPTPFKSNYVPDLSYIKSAAKSIASVLKKGNLVILESTSPVGTTEKIIQWMRDERPDLIFPELENNELMPDISVAYCPERVLPGNVLTELSENDRIIGGVSNQCALRAKDFYKIFVEADCLVCDCRTAELSKLVENSFRDVNIAYANELSLICDKLDINVWKLIGLANKHPRVNILQPGPGVGGHCIAVDPWFIIDSAKDESKLIRTARLVNDDKPNFVLKKIESVVRSTGKEKLNLSIACLGLSFKPDIDDLRESPALNIAAKVSLMGFKETFIVEPHITQLPEDFCGQSIRLVEVHEAIKKSDIVVLLVDHQLFKSIENDILHDKKIIDTRGTWS